MFILGSCPSSSSATAAPLNPNRHRRRSRPTKSKPTKLSPSKNPPFSLPSHPLLSSVQWDVASRSSSSLGYYAELASKLAEDGRLEDFAMIAEMALASGVSSSRFSGIMSLERVSKGVSRNLEEGKVGGVIEVLKIFQKLGIAPSKLIGGSVMELLRRECGRLLDSGEVEELVELLEVLASFQLTIKELVKESSIVKLCVVKRNPDLAIRYANLIPHAHIIFYRIISEFGKERDLKSALLAYEASKNSLSDHNMYICRAVIDVCGLCCDCMRSRLIFEDLLSLKVTPNIYVFNSLMNVNAHDLRYTLQLYKKMQNLGVKADMASHNILLKACCLAGRVDLAQDVYNEVKHLEAVGELKLDSFTYCTMIKVFADARLWQMAIRIKQNMLKAGVSLNMVTWSALISACANAGLVEQAIQLFQEMIVAGCEPNSQCCNTLLHACVEARQYDRAFRLFHHLTGSRALENFDENINRNSDDMLNINEHHRTFSARSSNHIANSHHLSIPQKFLFSPTTTTYNILMRACGTDYHRARAFMDEMKDHGLSPNHITWSILIDICGKSGNMEGATQILRTMHLTGIEPDVVAYTTCIKVCVECNNLRLAFLLYEEMKRSNILPNLVTYNTLLRARSRYGSLQEVQQCLSIYQDMRKAGYKPNDYFLKQLIEEWCEGVLNDKNPSQQELRSNKELRSNRADVCRAHSLLLEKIAVHLQSTVGSLAIDLQGLTKVEARIVVLAVLRMIRENHVSGQSVQGDISINLGAIELDTDGLTDNVFELKHAVIKLLHHELGLEVVSVEPQSKADKKMHLQSSSDSDPRWEETSGKEKCPSELVYPAQRPVIMQRLQRLKVTRISLHRWLQRKAGVFQR